MVACIEVYSTANSSVGNMDTGFCRLQLTSTHCPLRTCQACLPVTKPCSAMFRAWRRAEPSSPAGIWEAAQQQGRHEERHGVLSVLVGDLWETGVNVAGAVAYLRCWRGLSDNSRQGQLIQRAMGTIKPLRPCHGMPAHLENTQACCQPSVPSIRPWPPDRNMRRPLGPIAPVLLPRRCREGRESNDGGQGQPSMG